MKSSGFVDLETVPNQLGTAVLRLDNGAVKSCTGQMDGSVEVTTVLYDILLDTGLALRNSGEALRKIAVQFKGFQYVLTVANGEVYIVKKALDDTRGGDVF